MGGGWEGKLRERVSRKNELYRMVVQWYGMHACSYYTKGVINYRTVMLACVYTATPDRCAVLCYTVHKGQGSCSKK